MKCFGDQGQTTQPITNASGEDITETKNFLPGLQSSNFPVSKLYGPIFNNVWNGQNITISPPNFSHVTNFAIKTFGPNNNDPSSPNR